MKKSNKESNNYIFVYGLSIALAGIVLYPLFDVILCKFITGSIFVYSVHDHIIQPVLFGLIMGMCLYVSENGLKIKK